MVDKKTFIQQRLIDEIKSLSNNGYKRIALGMMAQYIETLGAFIDKKPFKAPRQSAIRFDMALEKLFPQRYIRLNNNGFLYKQLRSNFTHLGIESQFLNIVFNDVKDVDNEKTKRNHLKFTNKQTTICFSSFLNDYISACNTVLNNINDDDKKLA
ncbi:MAG: hypothetical protein KAG96_00265 [Ichthyobacteriaceae bacterium]|nr:hypothetical protein [Ichthyobacteriaceae bacterium]